MYVYCGAANDGMVARTEDMIATFIKQLLLHLERIQETVNAEAQERLQEFFGSDNAPKADLQDLVDIWGLIFAQTPKAIYIVDGIDEFEVGDVQRSLTLIRDRFKSTESKIYISTRRELGYNLDVERKLPGTIHISISSRDFGSNLDDDTGIYTEARFMEKMQDRILTESPELISAIPKRLLSGTNRMWALYNFY